MTTRRIMAAGGAETNEQKRAFVHHVVATASKASGKPNPTICLLAQASGENIDKAKEWQARIEHAGARFINLQTFHSGEPFEKLIAEADGFLVPGGNTRNMLLIWRDRGLDSLLRKAYDQGKVMAGYSAGGMCWFEETWTHQNPGELGRLECLGWLKGSFRPHYSQRTDLATEYEAAVKRADISPGYGLDDGIIAEFENEELARMSQFVPAARVVRVMQNEVSPLVVDVL